jgi:hypothetical protein
VYRAAGRGNAGETGGAHHPGIMTITLWGFCLLLTLRFLISLVDLTLRLRAETAGETQRRISRGAAAGALRWDPTTGRLTAEPIRS